MEIVPERKKIDLKTLEKIVNYFEDRRKRATERAALLQGNRLYFALVGFCTEVDRFVFGHFGWLEPVSEPPGEVELASAAKAAQIFGAVGRWAHGITHELVIDSPRELESETV